MTLDDIQKSLSTTKAPGILAEYRVVLSHKYGEATDRLEACQLVFDKWFTTHRENYKSDAATERAFGLTEEGQQMRHWELTLKKIDRMMSAINTLIKVKTEEARNTY